ncbi:MAG: hypothetical protein V6Z82_00705 [Flavobacteriales bacterium]
MRYSLVYLTLTSPLFIGCSDGGNLLIHPKSKTPVAEDFDNTVKVGSTKLRMDAYQTHTYKTQHLFSSHFEPLSMSDQYVGDL